jgi:hypothetical protein
MFGNTCMKVFKEYFNEEAKKIEGAVQWCIGFEMAIQINCLGLQRVLALVPELFNKSISPAQLNSRRTKRRQSLGLRRSQGFAKLDRPAVCRPSSAPQSSGLSVAALWEQLLP